MPTQVNDLDSTMADVVMATLAWNLKVWYGLLVPTRECSIELVEFRRVLHALLLLAIPNGGAIRSW